MSTPPPAWLLDRIRDLDENDGYVLLVVDPDTGEADGYGPYPDGIEAVTAADRLREDFDIAGLSNVLVRVTRLHNPPVPHPDRPLHQQPH
jgi:hypothetical protein